MKPQLGLPPNGTGQSKTRKKIITIHQDKNCEKLTKAENVIDIDFLT